MKFEKIIHSSKLFWVLQLAGWGGYWFLTSLFHLMVFPDIPSSIEWIEQSFVKISIGCGVSSFMYYLYQIIRKKFSVVFVLLFILFLSYLFTLIWNIIHKYAVLYLFDRTMIKYEWAYIFHLSFDTVFILLVWSGIYFAFTYWIDLRREKENIRRTKELLNQARFNMLKYQVNPHFLFNSFNSIIGLIDENKEKAKEVVAELSDFYRYSLKTGLDEQNTLGREIECIKNYLDVEKIRYEELLEIEWSVDDDVKNISVPGFIILPLVENALKYGMKTSPSPLKITIKIILKNNNLNIGVYNTGRLLQLSEEDKLRYNSTGVGLNNLQERLNIEYPGKFSFTLEEENGLVKASINIREIEFYEK